MLSPVRFDECLRLQVWSYNQTHQGLSSVNVPFPYESTFRKHILNPTNKHILIILDGYGIAVDPSVSAIHSARKPFLDSLFKKYPHATLEASGLAVGLPDGQMGNSEVGHMNLGAGRIVYQDITRIDRAIEDGTFFDNSVLREACNRVRKTSRKIHLIGLFSDGGVHSHVHHLQALLKFANGQELGSDQVIIHAFTDGRDTDPHGGIDYFQALQEAIAEYAVGRFASIVGRYWAMDRDRRWDRTQRAFDLLVHGKGEAFDSPGSALQDSYRHGVTDEFVSPRAIGTSEEIQSSRINGEDSVIFFNFRADRARQLTQAFIRSEFEEFDRGSFQPPHLSTFTDYSSDFDVPVVFPDVNLKATLGEVVSEQGGNQLRAAETEKYPHVTYFFSGGQEEPFPGEDRILVPSPKVATYDLQPEMSAPELARKLAASIAESEFTFVVLNFANPDMVGHTGVFDAAVAAVEAIDDATRVVVESALANRYTVNIISDHGNADCMMNPDGSPFTAHTTAPVPHLIIKEGFDGPIQDGKLGDIAPTILQLLNLPIPEEMTGDVLI
ncbi:MAG: 2,3-bisphosphoglycerate-independent phosphoglycerate mutase [Bacteroidetes bacterium]|nr:2,3-bisphosphoglycerate-independent phosphoglycerate mutase [Bacteroidota bacterium]